MREGPGLLQLALSCTNRQPGQGLLFLLPLLLPPPSHLSLFRVVLLCLRRSSPSSSYSSPLRPSPSYAHLPRPLFFVKLITFLLLPQCLTILYVLLALFPHSLSHSLHPISISEFMFSLSLSYLSLSHSLCHSHYPSLWLLITQGCIHVLIRCGCSPSLSLQLCV